VEKGTDAPFRLPVDRVFTITGFGTVVTGTLLAGEIRVGDEVELLPSGITSRVRGVQTHGSKEERGVAGQRVAVNLQGVEHTEVERGAVVVPRGIFRTTMRVDARLDYLRSSPLRLRHRQILRLHSATYEVPAQVILIDRDHLEPGDSAFVQLRMRTPVLLLPGDPFVLRASSPRTTVGGGRVLDPAPFRRRRRSEAALELLSALDGDSDQEKFRLLVNGSLLSGISRDDLLLRSGLSEKKVDAALTPLLTTGEVVMVLRDPKTFVSREALLILKGALLKGVKGYLSENPLKEGIGKEELKGRLPKRSEPRFFGNVLAALEKDGELLVDRDLVRLPGRSRVTDEDQATVRENIGRMLLEGGIEPPTLKELCERIGKDEKTVLEHLGSLAREGRVVKVKADLYYAAEPLASIREKLVSYLKEKGEITPGDFRELTSLSRKFMIPLLEYFDQEKLTIRVGEKRVLRKK
jgi:selenocysteine-specific elongation factor